MKPEEKKLLITTHLASRLKELMSSSTEAWINDDHVAELIMNGWESDAGDDMMKAHIPLWDIIAPLVDGLQIFKGVEALLTGRQGEALTTEVRDAIMLDVARIITTYSRATEPPRMAMHSRSTSTARVWGGAATIRDTPDDSAGLTPEDYRGGAGV